LLILLKSLTLFLASLLNLREHHVYSQFKHILQHPRQQSLKQVARLLNARVRVDLYQVDIKVLIKYEVVSKQLELVLVTMWINLPPNRVESLGDDLVHLGDHVLIHVEISIWVEFIYYVLEARE
jgi:hypothetical protein